MHSIIIALSIISCDKKSEMTTNEIDVLNNKITYDAFMITKEFEVQLHNGKWKEDFIRETKGTNKIVFKQGACSNDIIVNNEILIEGNLIEKLIDSFNFNDDQSYLWVDCPGKLLLEFYKDKFLLTSVTFVCKDVIRTPFWSNDVFITNKSSDELNEILYKLIGTKLK